MKIVCAYCERELILDEYYHSYSECVCGKSWIEIIGTDLEAKGVTIENIKEEN